MVEAPTKPVISPRVKMLRDSLVETAPRVSCERLRYLMESYRETDGQPAVIRRAKAFDKILGGMTLYIDENAIVGSLTRYRAGVQPFPEFSCEWMDKEVEFSGPLGKVAITEEDRKLISEAVAYWRGKSTVDKLNQIWAQKNDGRPGRDDLEKAGVFMDAADMPGMRICVDYGKVLNQGLNQVVREAQAELDKLPLTTLEALQKRDFLNAAIISCEAMSKFAQRYARLAEEMAQKEPNESRKAELLRIAEACRRVPANPARNFYEAIQSFWLIHITCLIGNGGAGFSPGRFSQYMYPFYQKDKDNGGITEDEALELLELLLIKFSEIARFDRKVTWKRTQGTNFQNISLGGVTAQGEDATNEIDFLLLEAQKRVRTIQPTLSVLYHDKMSPEFLLKAAEVVSTGIGMPAFFNNDLNVQRSLGHGVTLEDARNHCIIGCVESGFSHTGSVMRAGYVNVAKILELALNDGLDPVGGLALGPRTGRAEEFKSYDELHQALRKQLSYVLDLFRDSKYLSQAVNAEFFPVPWVSALVDDCIKKGADVACGGARYSMDGATPVGMVDVGDSMAAIKRLVFEEKRISMKQLLEALRANFEGKENVQRMLIDAPKYGNDIEYVDRIVREWYDIYFEEHQKCKDFLGHDTRPPALSVTAHFPFGVACGALPTGRKAGLPLTDATVSPEPGKDTNGPTALLRSAGRAIDTTKYASSQLNMKFHPSALKDKEGLSKLINLIKTYMDIGGHHVQFNVVSAATLKDAQLHPEKYRNLIVRVAGYSAFFIHLDTVVQNEIIKRTELNFG